MTEDSSSKEKESFTALSSVLDNRLLRSIAALGFTHPTPVQAKVIPLAVQGKDILARARTGSGKTLAYGIPAVQTILRKKLALSATDVEFHATRSLILVPTRELAEQVYAHLRILAEALGEDLIQVVNVAGDGGNQHKRSKNSTSSATSTRDKVQRLQLADKPDIVVATPSRALAHLRSKALDISKLECLIIDEADLILSYGHSSDDIRSILAGPWDLPTTYQSFLMSATMTGEVEELQGMVLRDPVVLLLNDEEDQSVNLTQYAVRCSEEDKYLLIYVILKLKLIKGKCLIFVNNTDRGYQLKLFLEKFGIKSGVLNAELPFNSRYHAVQEFNRGVFDYLIATDDSGVQGQDRDENTKEELIPTAPVASTSALPEGEVAPSPLKSQKRKRKPASAISTEYGVSRGIDFIDVSCVLNFDLPASSRSYTHRIGRTARAGREGMALSFVVPKAQWGKQTKGDVSLQSAKRDESVWKRIVKEQGEGRVKDYVFDMKQVEAFRYRMEDGLRSVTRASVREARIQEIKQEVLNSEKLQAHFEDNPKDLAFLRHDKPLHPARVQPHLKHVPSYLMPRIAPVNTVTAGEGADGKPNDRRVSFHKNGRGRGRGGKGGRGGRGGSKIDPLKKFSMKR